MGPFLAGLVGSRCKDRNPRVRYRKTHLMITACCLRHRASTFVQRTASPKSAHQFLRVELIQLGLAVTGYFTGMGGRRLEFARVGVQGITESRSVGKSDKK